MDIFFCEKSNWLIVLVSKPGGGVPDALQLRVTGSFLATVMSRGFSIMTGLLPSPLSAVASAVNGIAAKMKNAKSVYAEVLFYILHMRRTVCQAWDHRINIYISGTKKSAMFKSRMLSEAVRWWVAL